MSSKLLLRPASQNPTIYITGLTSSVTTKAVADKFGSIGRIKTDKRTGDAKIYIYNDKVTNTPKGDGTVTFEDPSAASAAVDWFNGTEFMGQRLTVQLAEEKEWNAPPSRGGRGAPPPRPDRDSGAYGRPGYADSDNRYGGNDRQSSGPPVEEMPYDNRGQFNRPPPPPSRSGARPGGVARGGGNGSGEWDCSKCSSLNFAKRIECFKCHAPKPVGGGSFQAPGPGPAQAGAGPNAQDDWTCMTCSNLNWGRRAACNRCSTPKPPARPAEKRTGRGGGYNEREDQNERREPSGRDSRSGSGPGPRDREFRNGDDRASSQGRYEAYNDDYGYGGRDRPPHSQVSGSRSSGDYRQSSGYRRDRSRSPRR